MAWLTRPPGEVLIWAALSAAPLCVQAQDAPAGAAGPGYELRCRGGPLLLFNTLDPVGRESTALRMSLTFQPSGQASGADGSGLGPSTCSWIDRPLNAQEPLQVWFSPTGSGPGPELVLRDSARYWSFMAYNTNRGHLEAAWHGSQPSVAGPPPRPGRETAIEFRHLQMFVIGWILIMWAPILGIVGRGSGWHRLAGKYPAVRAREARRIRCPLLAMGRRLYRGAARLTADVSYLHLSMMALFRPGHPPFSVPWSDISASRDVWPWFPFSGVPMIRLTLAKDPDLKILVRVPVGEAILAASGGRVRLSESPPTSEAPGGPARSRERMHVGGIARRGDDTGHG
jgi:hypothetical protein